MFSPLVFNEGLATNVRVLPSIIDDMKKRKVLVILKMMANRLETGLETTSHDQ